MRLLWVKAGRLLPVDTGGKIRTYNLLRQLAARHELTLLSYYDGGVDEEYDAALAREFPGAVPIATGVPAGRLGVAWHYATRIPSRLPYAVEKFTSPRVAARLARWYADGAFDVAVCDFLAASANFPSRLTIPTALFQHNVESALWKRQARWERSPLRRAAFALEAWKMARYEPRTVARFHHVIAVSDTDRALLAPWVPASRLSVVPTGVDVARFAPAAAIAPRDPRLIVFLGSMDWEANIDGVEFFCARIWPHVRQAVPGARFRIVGRSPVSRVRALASADVEVTGTVPDVIDHLADAAVVVVPLRIGGGTRLKIFEAMAAGRPVVSTTIGAEGLDVADGEEIAIADDAPAFADAVIRLLTDEAHRRRMGEAAARAAARRDWSSVVSAFEASLAATREAAPRDATSEAPLPASA